MNSNLKAFLDLRTKLEKKVADIDVKAEAAEIALRDHTLELDAWHDSDNSAFIVDKELADGLGMVFNLVIDGDSGRVTISKDRAQELIDFIQEYLVD